MCSWKSATSGGNGVENGSVNTVSPGSCVWQNPQFQLASVVVVTLFNAIISTPIKTCMQVLAEKVLLAPTVDEFKTVTEEMKKRMDIFEHNRSSSVPLDMNGVKEESENLKPFQVSSKINTPFHRQRRAAALVVRATSRSELPPEPSTADVAAYLAGDAGKDDPNDSKGEAKKVVQQLCDYAAGLGEEERIRLQSRWPSLENSNDDPKRGLVESELANVIEESTKSIERMKSLSMASRGEMLLQLFVLDLIGRKSRQGKIFSNQLDGKNVMLVTWGAKGITVAAIILMNLYFALTCMLYGREHGKPSRVCVCVCVCVLRQGVVG